MPFGLPPWRETGLAALPAGLAVAFLLLVGHLTPFAFAGALAVGLLGAVLVALGRQREFEALRAWLEGLAEGRRLLPPDAAGPLASEGLVRPVLGLAREGRRLRRLSGSQERILLTLIESLPDPVLLVDAGETVLQANEAARRGFGVPDGRPPLGRFLRDPGLLAAVRAALEAGEASQLAFSPPTDRLKQFAARVAPTVLADGGKGALILLREETEQVMIERMRSDFVANASHEIRTPLASLTGFIETLRGPARNDPEARESFLALMAEETARLDRLVNGLLSLSRIELAAIAPPEGRCGVEAVVETVLARLRPVAEAAGVDLRHEPAGDLPDAAADADQIHQLLLNLVDNAIKYGGKEVAVTAGFVARAPGDSGPLAGRPALCVAVSDGGPGIAREHLPRLTERFYRVDKHRSREKGGTGLGLAIVKHIVRRHRGHLAITSAPGRGSRFAVLLPLAPG
ncbi:MAG: PAS domain-containing protein [Geminicoccaceae bacterium]|nr:PAS domain-containing protein [Geminicoccaceae bacterium]